MTITYTRSIKLYTYLFIVFVILCVQRDYCELYFKQNLYCAWVYRFEYDHGFPLEILNYLYMFKLPQMFSMFICLFYWVLLIEMFLTLCKIFIWFCYTFCMSLLTFGFKIYNFCFLLLIYTILKFVNVPFKTFKIICK